VLTAEQRSDLIDRLYSQPKGHFEIQTLDRSESVSYGLQLSEALVAAGWYQPAQNGTLITPDRLVGTLIHCHAQGDKPPLALALYQALKSIDGSVDWLADLEETASLDLVRITVGVHP